jgi:hypothetical protein
MYVLLFLFVVLPSLACGYLFRYLTSQEWPRLRQALYFPIAGQSRWEHRTQRLRLLQRLGGVEVTVHTADDRDVHCVWIPRPRLPPGAVVDDDEPVTTPVVLCLHANAMVLDDMIDWAQFYLVRGVSVMLVTFWGYPDPDEPDDEPMQAADASLLAGPALRCPSEQTMYHDAEAALRYINEVRGDGGVAHAAGARPAQLRARCRCPPIQGRRCALADRLPSRCLPDDLRPYAPPDEVPRRAPPPSSPADALVPGAPSRAHRHGACRPTACSSTACPLAVAALPRSAPITPGCA